MSRLRFTTAHEVLDAFAAARDDIGPDMPDDAPVRYMVRLAESAAPDSAVAFCAYMLPRREAVWWGCQCLRQIAAPGAEGSDGLKAAEAWVVRPDDATRRAALALGMSGDLKTAPPWLALGAGWAGGSMAMGEHPVPAPAYLTAKAVNASILLALANEPPARRRAAILAMIAAGQRLADGKETL